MIFIFLYDHKLKSGANKKIQAFMNFVSKNKMDIEFILDDSAKYLDLNLNYRLVKFKNRIQKLLFFRQNFQKEKIISDFVGSTFLNKNIYWLIHDIRPIYGYKGKLYAVIYRYLLKTAKNIIVISNFTKNEVLNINPTANVIMWKNGIAKEKPVRINEKISYDVIMVGAFVARKGHLEALQLLQIYSENHSIQMKICLAGTKGEILDKIYSHSYKNLILEVNVGLSEDELKTKWLSSKCTLSNSQYEGFNYTVLESLSLLKNVILTDIPGHSHFKDLEGCYFFTDIDSFGIAIKRALSTDLTDVKLSNFDEEINTENFIKSL